MKLLKGWKIRLLAGLAIATTSGQVDAQMMPGSPYPDAMGPQSPMMYASHAEPGMQGYSEGGSAPMVFDPSCGVESCGPGGMGAGMGGFGPGFGDGCGPNGCGPGFGNCMGGGMGFGGEGCGPGCGPYGCGPGCGILGGGVLGRFGEDRCDIFGRSKTGFRKDIFGWLASKRGCLRPYGEGGVSTQRWFDISAEAMFLARTKGSSDFVFSSNGIDGPRVLTGNMVELDDLQAGLGLQANIQTGPGSNLEVLYFGLNQWDDSARVTSTTPSLFSFISNFGTLPANGFDDSDRSFVHQLDYSSELHNGEVNFRRRWSEPYGFFQGSFLGGIRYMDISEGARFTAQGAFDNTFANNSQRFFDYRVNTTNSLVGFQLGGDLWYNFLPGVKLGGELKSGVYNNNSRQTSVIAGNSLTTFTESIEDDQAAFITQGSAQLWYRLNYSWAFRSAYQVMCIDNVALATNNFNPVPPTTFGVNRPRTLSVNNDSNVVYQGFSLGAEYTW
jgi:hypothetical protein